MERPPFPEVIDSSLIAAARSCGQKVNLEYFHHWKPKDPSVHLKAGAAYAKGLEVARRSFYEQGMRQEDSIALGINALLKEYGDFQCPPDSAKSAERTAGALEFYFERYPMADDKAKPLVLPAGKTGIEFNFVEPIDYKHPITGNPLVYVGRMDMVCTFDNMILGEDDKTTSSLGASWPKQWDLRSQFTGYVWGAMRSGIRLDGFLVRGVSILKTKYDTLQSITYRPEWQLDRWYTQLLRDIKKLEEQWQEGYFDFNLDHACTEYGGCLFRDVCLTRDPDVVLPQLYERRRWDPINRIEIPLDR